MQAKAAGRHAHGRRLATAGMLAGALAAWSAPGAAQTAPDLRNPFARPGQTESNAAARCAHYGEGFVPVAGGNGCVKIGGRLRIDLGASAPAPVYSGPRDGVNPAAHLRLNAR